MSIAQVVTLGFGNGTFAGSVALVTLLGFSTDSSGDGDSAAGAGLVLPDNSINRAVPDASYTAVEPAGSINRTVPD